MEKKRLKKLRLSSMFLRSSLAFSCSSRSLDQVIDKSVLIPKPRPSSSSFRTSSSLPRVSDKSNHDDVDVISLYLSPKHDLDHSLPRRNSSERYHPPSILHDNGRRCPPASPISPPLNPTSFDDLLRRQREPESQDKGSRVHKAKDKCPYSSEEEEEEEDWFSLSSDETERSLSSDSSESRLCHQPRRMKGPVRLGSGDQYRYQRQHRMENSFAVVKSSSDPYGDFRRSMVEMIVEKEMYGAEDLQKLLECFLSLNSQHHHRVILQVFGEIWEALFSS